MRRFILLMSGLFLLTNACEAVWVWTPKTRRFENARHAGMDTPKRQEEFAKQQKEEGDALVQWQTLLRRFPHSKEAPKALYNIGEIYLQRNDLFNAYRSFVKVLKEYPYSEETAYSARKLLDIGRRFSEDYGRKWWDLSKPIDNPAPEIFELIVKTLPYSREAEEALYLKSLFYFNRKDYEKAREAIQRLLDEYPDSDFDDDAEFLNIKALAQMSLRPDYDQKYALDAENAIKEFLAKYPDSGFADQAQKLLSDMQEKRAANMLKIAEFYLKQGKKQAAVVYLKQIVSEYPKVGSFKKAMNLLDRIKSNEL